MTTPSPDALDASDPPTSGDRDAVDPPTPDDASDPLDDFADLLRDGGDANVHRTPPVRDPARRRRAWRALIAVCIVIVVIAGLVGGYVTWALNAPLPAPVGTTRELPPPTAGATALALPTDGAYAISVAGGADYLGEAASGIWQAGAQDEVRSIASITKLVTALVVLDRHPLADASDPGPTLTFDAADHKLYDKYYVMDATIAEMPTGTTMSLHDALATMLIPSASNYAEAVAEWAFGSTGGFASAARRWLAANGLTQTTIVEPTGIDPRNTSTALDMIALGRLAAANPAIVAITGTGQATFDGPGTIVNTNRMLRTHGITGLKTGTLDEAGSNLLYTATLDVGIGEPLSVVGVLLGATSSASVDAGVGGLLDSIVRGFRDVEVARAGTVLGHYATVWGDEVELVVGETATLHVWSDTPIAATTDIREPTRWTDGEQVGTVTLTAGPQSVSVPVVVRGSITEPDSRWRLEHPAELVG